MPCSLPWLDSRELSAFFSETTRKMAKTKKKKNVPLMRAIMPEFDLLLCLNNQCQSAQLVWFHAFGPSIHQWHDMTWTWTFIVWPLVRALHDSKKKMCLTTRRLIDNLVSSVTPAVDFACELHYAAELDQFRCAWPRSPLLSPIKWFHAADRAWIFKSATKACCRRQKKTFTSRN